MARRTNHTTNIATIPSQDLTDLGTNKLNNPNLLHAYDTNALAISNRYIILVLEWSNGSSGQGRLRVKIRPNLSPIEAEYVSALEWLVFDDIRVIAVGTSCGYFLVFSLSGDLIHKQVLTFVNFFFFNKVCVFGIRFGSLLRFGVVARL